jgi:hypothetical protein
MFEADQFGKDRMLLMDELGLVRSMERKGFVAVVFYIDTSPYPLDKCRNANAPQLEAAFASESVSCKHHQFRRAMEKPA